MSQLTMEAVRKAWDKGFQTVMKKVPIENAQVMKQKLKEKDIDFLEIPMQNEHIFAVFERNLNDFLDIQKEVFHFPFSVENQKNSIITIMHGTDHELQKPKYGLGSLDCDYGRGFYMIERNIVKW